MAERRPLGFHRLEEAPAATQAAAAEPEPSTLDDRSAAQLLPERPARGHKGTFG